MSYTGPKAEPRTLERWKCWSELDGPLGRAKNVGAIEARERARRAPRQSQERRSDESDESESFSSRGSDDGDKSVIWKASGRDRKPAKRVPLKARDHVARRRQRHKQGQKAERETTNRSKK